MYHFFKIIKENEQLNSFHKILESLEDGAVVFSIIARNVERPNYLSTRFIVDYLKGDIRSAYTESNFVQGGSGMAVNEFFQKEFDVIIKLSPEKVWAIHSQYRLRYSIILPEVGKFMRTTDYISPDKLTITRNSNNIQLAEIFSSAKLQTFRKTFIQFRLANPQSVQVYLTYKFTTNHGYFAAFNSLLIVFKIQRVRICRFKEEYLKWTIKTERPMRLFYSQNTEWQYYHPFYSKYVQIEDIFWRGDLKQLKNCRINLFFSPEKCQKHQFLRICEILKQKQKIESYSVETKMPDPRKIQLAQILKPPNFKEDKIWFNYSLQSQEFPPPAFEEMQNPLLVRQATFLNQGIKPCFLNLWLYSEKNLKIVEDIVFVRCPKSDQNQLHYKWQFPFFHFSKLGIVNIGEIEYCFMGGSWICQKRREFYLVKKESKLIELLKNEIKFFQIKSLFSLKSSEIYFRYETDIKQQVFNFNNNRIGWINLEMIHRQITHKPVEKILIRFDNTYGYVMPISDSKIQSDLLLHIKRQLAQAIKNNSFEIIEIVTVKTAFLTDVMLTAFEQASINYQMLKISYLNNYQALSNCLNSFIMSREVHPLLQQFSLWYELNVFKSFGVSKQFQKYICQVFERQYKYYKIGVWIQGNYIVNSEKDLPIDSVISNPGGKEAFILVKIFSGYKILKFNIQQEYNKYRSNSCRKYIIFSKKLRNILKNHQIVLITCPHLKKKLIEHDKNLTKIQQIIEQSIDIPPDHGYLSYMRKYLESFGTERFVPFNNVKNSELQAKWLGHLPQSTGPKPPLKYCKDQILSFFKWTCTQVQVYMSAANCRYFDIWMDEANVQYLYSLRKLYFKRLNESLSPYIQNQLVQIIKKGDFDYEIRYIELHYLFLCCGTDKQSSKK